MTADEGAAGPGAQPTGWQRLRREFTTVHPHSDQHWGAVQVAVCMVLPLALVVGLGRTDLAAYAVFGSMCSVYGSRLGRADRLKVQVVAGVAMTAAVGVGALPFVSGPGGWWPVVAMAVMSGVGPVLSRAFGLLPVPSLFLVFATGTVSAAPHTWGQTLVAVGVSAAAAVLGVLAGQVSLALRRSLVPERSAPAGLHGTDVLPELVLFTAAPAAAGLIAHGLSFGHPWWAAVAATVPLTGRGLTAQVGRAGQRVLGTVVGIVVAWALLSLDPPVWVLIVVVGTLQVLTELFITRHYGIAVVFITPMALILGHLAAPSPVGELLADRMVQTALGVAVACAVLLIARTARR